MRRLPGDFPGDVREISAGRTEQLESLLPDLVELTLAPYVGGEEAERLARQ